MFFRRNAGSLESREDALIEGFKQLHSAAQEAASDKMVLVTELAAEVNRLKALQERIAAKGVI